MDWICKVPLAFNKVRDLRNNFNKGHPSWAGRDGQELDPETGRDLALSFALDSSIDFEQLRRTIDRSKSLKNAQRNRYIAYCINHATM